MKGLVIFLAILTTITSCDAPRDRRSLVSNNMNGMTGPLPRDPISNPTTPTTPVTTTPTTPAIPSDAQHCKFATDGVNGFESTSTHLDSYTLCQSSTDKNVMYFQLKTLPAANVSICFIPTVSYSDGNSIYVGNPMCGYFTSTTQVRKISFVKFAQYQNSVINGAIFFKDLAFSYPYPFNSYTQTMTLDAYRTCMYAISSYPKNPAYCQAFKQVNQYVYKQF
jgi:hypothetical protein